MNQKSGTMYGVASRICLSHLQHNLFFVASPQSNFQPVSSSGHRACMRTPVICHLSLVNKVNLGQMHYYNVRIHLETSTNAHSHAPIRGTSLLPTSVDTA